MSSYCIIIIIAELIQNDMNNYEKHEYAMEIVRRQLRARNWIVIPGRIGKSDYFLIKRNKDTKPYKIKVKGLSKRTNIPFSTTPPGSINENYTVICCEFLPEKTEFFVVPTEQINLHIQKYTGNYYLQVKDYDALQGLELFDGLQ